MLPVETWQLSDRAVDDDPLMMSRWGAMIIIIKNILILLLLKNEVLPPYLIFFSLLLLLLIIFILHGIIIYGKTSYKSKYGGATMPLNCSMAVALRVSRGYSKNIISVIK